MNKEFDKYWKEYIATLPGIEKRINIDEVREMCEESWNHSRLYILKAIEENFDYPFEDTKIFVKGELLELRKIQGEWR